MAINFDPKSVAVVMPDSVCVMAEIYCLEAGSVTKDFPLGSSVTVDSVSGTLSFQGLNWSIWKFGNTAICGWIGSEKSNLLAFDIQAKGRLPQTIPVSAVFPGGVEMSSVHFNLLADLNMPTDFRAALVFHRKN